MSAARAMRFALAASAAALLVAGCSNTPPAPDWQMNAFGAMQRYQSAWLAGATRAADAEFARMRAELASTGQPALVARAELTRCALQVAALAFEPCIGFEPLRPDVDDAQRAYADYLAGQALDASRAALLPPGQRAAAASSTEQALRGIDDPLSRLVAAGVMVRRGVGTPQVLEVGAQTASAQGWKRAVLAWLGAQAMAARQRGDTAEAERLQRRIELAGRSR